MLHTQKKQRKSLGSFFKKSCPTTSTGLTDKETMERELDKYLLRPDADNEMDPLQWWKIQFFYSIFFFKTSRVSCLAKRYLCIPATSNSSERVFSTGGNIVTGKL